MDHHFLFGLPLWYFQYGLFFEPLTAFLGTYWGHGDGSFEQQATAFRSAFGRGSNAAFVAKLSDVRGVLASLSAAVEAGELDASIAKAIERKPK